MECRNCGGPIHSLIGSNGGFFMHEGNWSACYNYYVHVIHQKWPGQLPGGRAEPLLEEEIVSKILIKYEGNL